MNGDIQPLGWLHNDSTNPGPTFLDQNRDQRKAEKTKVFELWLEKFSLKDTSKKQK